MSAGHTCISSLVESTMRHIGVMLSIVTLLSTMRSVVSAIEVVQMCTLLERNTGGQLLYDYNRAEAAIIMAVDYVNEVILAPTHRINITYRNIGRTCPAEGGLTLATQQALALNDAGINCDAYLGPGCGAAADSLYDLAVAWETPVLGCPAASVGLLTSPDYYSRLTRTSFTYPSLKGILIRFLLNFNYTTPVFFVDKDNPFFYEMGTLIRSAMQYDNPEYYQASKFVEFQSSKTNFARLKELLSTAALNSRVYFLFMDANSTRRFLLGAHRLGYTNGEFVFIAIELYENRLWGHYTWQSNDENDETMRQAFEALLILSLQLSPDADSENNILTFWQRVTGLSQSVYNYTFSPDDLKSPDPIVIHFYEAVLLYGTTVQRMYKAHLNYSNGLDFTAFVANISFPSPLTGMVYLDGNSERQSVYNMRSYDAHSGKHTPFLQFPVRTTDVVPTGAMTFVDSDSLPPNEPRCGFRNDNPVCIAERQSHLPPGATEAAAIVPTIVIIAAIVGGAYAVKKIFYDLADPFWWRIILQDIEIRTNTTTARSLARSSALKSSKSITSIPNGITANGKAPSEPLSTKTNSVTSLKDAAVEKLSTRQGTFAGVSCSLVELPSPKRRVPGALPKEAALARGLIHPNVQKFIGIAVNEENQCDCVVGEVCQKGTLKDLIDDHSMNLDWEFKNSLIKDLANGIGYIHLSKIRSHGFLSDESCLIDNRFILKVANFGFPALKDARDLQALNPGQEDRDYRILLWRAPELLRRTMPASGTQLGDVYSYAILLQQIVLRSAPYHMGSDAGKTRRKATEEISDRDIVQDVKRGLVPPLRPAVPVSACPMPLHELMGNCWDEDPLERPNFTRIKTTITKIIGKSGENIVDHLIKRMEQYAAGLEHQVDMKMKQFMEERARSAGFLSAMLPKSVAEALSKGIAVIPETYENCTVYFGDVPGFTDAIEECKTATETVDLLNKLYTLCDTTVASFDAFKVECINDAYLVASGVPIRNGHKHAEQLASMALVLRKDILSLKSITDKARNFKLRAGLHSGSCVAGVIGLKMPRYCLFGDTVNTASRMESHGETGKIHLSPTTKALLDRYDDFIVMERGIIDVKGKGPMTTYWLVGRG
ncbi:atrial natriuretic peptide receptor 1-like [Paramacrobiotus metropolitanus]|uniref:atrial natriuretic peptide receptor 1-like n=1 Tax=Paramacrobiotus metropolitanus TaxID=2943436 RepID=UPI0024456F8F|nr:atrial natriuretic peptide receptor 1-like [Paramacrobiotus metropolitanus]